MLDYVQISKTLAQVREKQYLCTMFNNFKFCKYGKD